jgi:hypothetical protein
MHGWRFEQTPVIFDARANGRVRKLVSIGARNGYFLTVHRTTGEHVASGKFSEAVNWANGLDEGGRPILNPSKVATIGGAIGNSATNGAPAAYSPDTGLFYWPENNSLGIWYLIDEDPRGSMGVGGTAGGGGVSTGASITATDPLTARIVWRHELPGGGATGMLTTMDGFSLPAATRATMSRTESRCGTRASAQCPTLRLARR